MIKDVEHLNSLLLSIEDGAISSWYFLFKFDRIFSTFSTHHLHGCIKNRFSENLSDMLTKFLFQTFHPINYCNGLSIFEQTKEEIRNKERLMLSYMRH